MGVRGWRLHRNCRLYSIACVTSWLSFFVQTLAVSWLAWDLFNHAVLSELVDPFAAAVVSGGEQIQVNGQVTVAQEEGRTGGAILCRILSTLRLVASAPNARPAEPATGDVP